MTPEMRSKLRSLLVDDEGFREKIYTDTTGHLSIGIGRNLTDRGITFDEAMMMLNNDIAYFTGKLSQYLPFFDDISDVRKIVLISLCFNLGVRGFLEFKKMLAAVEHGDYALAAHEILSSRAAQQLPQRYQRLSTIMRTNEL